MIPIPIFLIAWYRSEYSNGSNLGEPLFNFHYPPAVSKTWKIIVDNMENNAYNNKYERIELYVKREINGGFILIEVVNLNEDN